ncbi:ribonuclease H-like domain-containing protein, partial [Tanacetum coccineum]
MEAGTTSTTLTARLPILNPGEYDLWLMRIEQYFLMTDYSLWEVILNGNKVLKRTVGEVKQEYEPTFAEEKQDRRNEMKAKGTLLMTLPNKDQLKFHSYKDPKLLMEAIEKRYEGNKESKKVQRTLLKQQYENFAGSSSETMDQTFDRLQKLISHLEIQGEVITQEDMNLKLLRSLPSEWKTRALIWRNKEEIETISLDDLYNNLKIYEPELIGSTNTSQNSQNMAFMSSNITNSNSSTNEANNTNYGVSAAHTQSNPTYGDNLSDAMICAFLASQPNSPQLAREDLEQIDPDDLEEMDSPHELTEEKQDRRNEMKARGTLLMALPNKDQLMFHSYKDAKLLIEAIEKRYGGNKESKKVQRTLLKQQYENFLGSSSETMDQTFDRLQKLISQLEIQGEVITQEDMNLKLLRSLPSEWKTHALIWRNKEEIETISLDDFTNSNCNNSINEVDNTAHGVSATHTQCNSTSGDNLSYAMISRRFIQRTGRKLDVNGQRFGFDKSKVECYNCHKNGHFARECRLPKNQEKIGKRNNRRTVTVETPTENALEVLLVQILRFRISKARLAHYKKNEAVFEESINVLNLEVKLRDNYALVENKKKLEKAEKERDELKLTLEKFQNSSKSLNNMLERNFIPRKPDLTFMDEIVESENLDVTTVVTPSNDKTVENKGVSNTVESNAVRMNNSGAPIIEDWNSDDESEVEPNDKTVRPSTEKIKSIKAVNFEHLHYVCDKKVVRPMWNNSRRVNHKNFSNKMTHPYPKRSFVPQAVLTRTGKINTAGANVNTAGASINIVIRPINSAASTLIGNPQQKEYKEKAVIDSGCSKHMIGNNCYLDEYEDYDGGFISFGDGKGRISRK